MRVDVHQHLWTERFCSALARRSAAPRLRRRDGGWLLELAGEAPFLVGSLRDDPDARVVENAEHGVDLALVALSSALGVEGLPPHEAADVVEAWHEDVIELPAGLAGWGALSAPDADAIDRALAVGVGVSVPAGALADPHAIDAMGPALERLERRGAPLFVHPGPATAGTWLPALTSYVCGMHAAWLAWALHGRLAHPALNVVFAALAGLAPLQGERVEARAGTRPSADPRSYYETSSYGPQAIAAVAAAAGPGALLYGSDRPYAPHGDLRAPQVDGDPVTLLRLPVAA
jgi:hypothetical protein